MRFCSVVVLTSGSFSSEGFVWWGLVLDSRESDFGGDLLPFRSSYASSFFVLPCCHWDFAGKFRYKEAGRSQYRTYLEFVRNVGETCDFHVQEDTLRIPSTKRVSII